MANRYYTLMIVPEKSSRVRKITLPSWMLKGSAGLAALLSFIGLIMFIDYWVVMGQIEENRQLRLENRRLKQQVQVFRTKITSIESAMDRIKTFATRLKVITNIEDKASMLQSAAQKALPDAQASIEGTESPSSNPKPQEGSASGIASHDPNGQPPSPAEEVSSRNRQSLLDWIVSPTRSRGEIQIAKDPSEAILRQEFDQIDLKFAQLGQDTLSTEQTVQELYEDLLDRRSFLSALPTRKPTVGYFTSGFGVRRSPTAGGRVKIHEGVDIANYPGTAIKAPADGVVTFAQTKAGYGQTVVLDHGYGLETWYAHARRITVKRDQKVKRGETIALLGNSGRTTGPHLHYEVRVHGIPVDPLDYILER